MSDEKATVASSTKDFLVKKIFSSGLEAIMILEQKTDEEINDFAKEVVLNDHCIVNVCEIVLRRTFFIPVEVKIYE